MRASGSAVIGLCLLLSPLYPVGLSTLFHTVTGLNVTMCLCMCMYVSMSGSVCVGVCTGFSVCSGGAEGCPK